MTQIKLGILPLYIKLYDDVWPEMRPRLLRFYEDVCREFEKRSVSAVRTEPCRLRQEFDDAVAAFEREGAEAVVTLHLAYSPSLESIGALTRTPLPLIVLDTTETDDFTGCGDPDAVMYNHGIHGVQDLCTMLIRSGKRFCIEAGHYRSSDVVDRAVQDALGLRMARSLRHARVGAVGGPFEGMGDFAVSPEHLRRELGVEIRTLHDEEAEALLGDVSDEEIDAETAADRQRFEVLTDGETHRRVARAELALRRFVQKEGLTALTVNFMGMTGRGLGLMPFTECCKAMDRGVGYAGEGDVLTAALCGALLSVCPESTFTEMFCADWKNNRIFLSHMGEVNHRLLEGRPQLLPKPFPFSDAPDTAFLCGALREGEGVYVNLAPVGTGKYRLIIAGMRMLPMLPHPAADASVRGLLDPGCDVARFLERYSRVGGTHHSVFLYGDMRRALRVFGEEMGFEVADLTAGS